MDKYNSLLENIRKYKNVYIAFSGGVDSTFLLYAAIEALGTENVMAITVKSVFMPQRELKEACKIIKLLGASHKIIEADVLTMPEVIENGSKRCYYCKKAVFTMILNEAHAIDAVVMDGSNADDSNDYRPGAIALAELGILSPLKDVGLTKQEIRKLSNVMELPTYNKPSLACLATRIPYNEPITQEALELVERAEEKLRQMGFTNYRVRHHGYIARIEMSFAEFGLAFKHREALSEDLKALGYKFVALELTPFKSGNMNTLL